MKVRFVEGIRNQCCQHCVYEGSADCDGQRCGHDTLAHRMRADDKWGYFVEVKPRKPKAKPEATPSVVFEKRREGDRISSDCYKCCLDHGSPEFRAASCGGGYYVEAASNKGPALLLKELLACFEVCTYAQDKKFLAFRQNVLSPETERRLIKAKEAR